jgi:hypothetical protein
LSTIIIPTPRFTRSIGTRLIPKKEVVAARSRALGEEMLDRKRW